MDQKNVDRIAQAVVARLKDDWVLRAPFIDGDPNNTTGNKELSRLLTVKEAAVYLGRSVSALYKLVWRKQISCVRHGRNLRFDRFELIRWVERYKV
jgi:excisionase family DNA binding protein